MGNSISNSDFGGHNLTDTPVEFLKRFRPLPWTLCSIWDGTIKARTFTDPAPATKWIAERNGELNLYHHAGKLWPGNHTDKASRKDVSTIEYFHADVDVEPPTKDALTSKLGQIRAYLPAPTVIVFSGGGFNVYWKLTDPILAPGGSRTNGELWKPFEAQNRQLEIDLTDSRGCYDVCRLLRLPWTMNVLSATKIGKGRKPVLSRLIEFNDRTCTPDQFRRASGAAGARSGPVEVVRLPPNLPKVDVNSLPLDGRWKSIIILGYDVLNPDRYRSGRSGAVFAVTMAMCRSSIDDATIASVLLDPRNGISEHVLEQPSPRAYVKRQIANARGRINDHRS